MNRQNQWLFETTTASYPEYEADLLESEWEVRPPRRPTSPLRRPFSRQPSRPIRRAARSPQRRAVRPRQQRRAPFAHRQFLPVGSVSSPPSPSSGPGILIATIDRFEFGSYLLKRHQFEQLQDLTFLLIANKGSPVKLTFIGHTDNAGGETPGNFHLAGRRAMEVENYIMRLFRERHPDFNLASSISGRGSREPIAPNTTKDGQVRNRRVEVFSDVPLKSAN